VIVAIGDETSEPSTRVTLRPGPLVRRASTTSLSVKLPATVLGFKSTCAVVMLCLLFMPSCILHTVVVVIIVVLVLGLVVLGVSVVTTVVTSSSKHPKTDSDNVRGPSVFTLKVISKEKIASADFSYKYNRSWSCSFCRSLTFV
jgi:uncharacterized membrane protein YdfJ with MMPL/SSD domain